ncbi:MAG: rod shape-determining protein MreC [Clostridiales bacterium]|nr:rod shape-determining protein MreC [Clostridiales bacterium]
MRKIFGSRWFIVSVVVLIITAVIVVGALPGSPLNFHKVFGGAGKVFTPVQDLVRKSASAFDDYYTAVFDGVSIREENEHLRAEIAELQLRLRQNEEAAIRYEELKDAFHIKDSFSNFDVYGAKVLSYGADEWFSSVRADIGTDTGLEALDGISYVVVDVNMNLVGRVVEISDSESIILPLLHEGFSVTCKVNEVNGETFVLKGDTNLKRSGLCRITGINVNDVPAVGSEIVTSGEGGVFPEGIPVGTIIEVDAADPLNIYAVLQPYSDISELQDIFVLVPATEPLQEPDDLNNEGVANEAQ